jgi:hypothetical protein
MKQISHEEACKKLSEWLNVPFDVMSSRLKDYTFTEVRGAIISCRGPELHATAPNELQGKWFGKDVVREIMKPILTQYGYIKTTVPNGYPKGLEFVKRLGFKNVGGINWELRC